MNLMKAESPGPSVNRLVPKVQSTAKILYTIYLGMTLLQILLLLIGKMPLFDTLCITFGTAGTGGFGIKNSSIAGYSTYIQVIVTIFMILFGINFNVYFLLLTRKFTQAFKHRRSKILSRDHCIFYYYNCPEHKTSVSEHRHCISTVSFPSGFNYNHNRIWHY